MFGAIAAVIIVLFVGCNIHHQHKISVYKQEQAQRKKIRILQRKIKQLKADKYKKIRTFHGDEIANLGGDDVR